MGKRFYPRLGLESSVAKSGYIHKLIETTHLSRRNFSDEMASASTGSTTARFAIVLSALRPRSNCRRLAL
jgi:hypothetical protein